MYSGKRNEKKGKGSYYFFFLFDISYFTLQFTFFSKEISIPSESNLLLRLSSASDGLSSSSAYPGFRPRAIDIFPFQGNPTSRHYPKLSPLGEREGGFYCFRYPFSGIFTTYVFWVGFFRNVSRSQGLNIFRVLYEIPFSMAKLARSVTEPLISTVSVFIIG